MKKSLLVFMLFMSFIAGKTMAQSMPNGYWDQYVATSFAGGDGSVETPFLIESAEQLAYLAQEVNSGKPFTKQYVQIKAGVKELNLSAHFWVPIGTFEENDLNKTFQGNFDGNNAIISGLNIGVACLPKTNNTIGLFGYLYATDGNTMGGIKNLTLKNGNIQGWADSFHSGAFAGHIRVYSETGKAKIRIDNCRNESVSVQGGGQGIEISYTGGILGAGRSDSKGSGMGELIIENCANEATVRRGEIAAAYTGGILGYGYGLGTIEIKNVTNSGSVIGEGNYTYTGGIMGNCSGYSQLTMLKCSNNGNITGGKYIAYTGGLLGCGYGTSYDTGVGILTIKDCYSYATITAAGGYVGGLGGRIETIREGSVFIQNVYAAGTISGGEYTGGLAGMLSRRNNAIHIPVIENSLAVLKEIKGDHIHRVVGRIARSEEGLDIYIDITNEEEIVKYMGTGNYAFIQAGGNWTDDLKGADGAEWESDLTRLKDLFGWTVNHWNIYASSFLPQLKSVEGTALIHPKISYPFWDTSEEYCTVTISGFDRLTAIPGMGHHQRKKKESFAVRFELPQGYEAEDILVTVNGVKNEFSLVTGRTYRTTIREVIEDTEIFIGKAPRFAISVPQGAGFRVLQFTDTTYCYPTNDLLKVGRFDTPLIGITLEDDYDQSEITLLADGEEVKPMALRSSILYYLLPAVEGDMKLTVEGVKKNQTDGMQNPSEQFAIHMEGQTLYITVSQRMPMTVYTITGNTHTALTLPEGTTSVNLRPGIYLLKIGNDIRKIKVK
ncbi:hypothetical protein [Parabacteroides sp. PF5-9]|uniref:hypothetical protein n=1 Tax=Parabacteroides sp. PF5-9 TaxID=1742404 RepID=UPI0024747B42|nr:hypothetical protein [Parabacteroides sp. PF5-9]MDH6356700.1 hypothetical protein [Parabacteroides sp. PF5-9]